MQTGIDEHQHVACIRVDMDGMGECIHPVTPGVVACARVEELRVVAAWHDHRGAVAGADVGECHEHVQLATAELSVSKGELRATRRVVTAGVDRVVTFDKIVHEIDRLDKQGQEDARYRK